MAGPNPFQSAVTPSAAMSFLAQSMKPEYVPDGADWRRDLIVCSSALHNRAVLLRFFTGDTAVAAN